MPRATPPAAPKARPRSGSRRAARAARAARSGFPAMGSGPSGHSHPGQDNTRAKCSEPIPYYPPQHAQLKDLYIVRNAPDCHCSTLHRIAFCALAVRYLLGCLPGSKSRPRR